MAVNRTSKKTSRSTGKITLNISAFEIIPRGKTIVINASTPIDEKSLGSGLRFDQVRPKRKISKKGSRVEIAADESFAPGRNTLYLSGLYTPDGKPIDADLKVPFFIVDSKAAFPEKVCVESYSRVVVESDRIRRAEPGEKAAYELMKGTERASGKTWEAAYDKSGKKIDFDRVRAEITEKRLKRYGKLEPNLYKQLKAGGEGPYSAAIWLTGKLPVIDKNEKKETVKEPEAEAAARKTNTEMSRRFIEANKLKSVDKNVSIARAAPVIFAELDRETIRALADKPEVSMIFYYDKEGIEDLSNSMAIAQTDEAHDRGYTGRRVKVAVYEHGPDDRSDLRIEARFSSSPTLSEHARHTHAIIKNRESGAPHGHAPDCLLHSANKKVLDALDWATKKGCTVISQSFHRKAEQTDSDLSFDDVYKDLIALLWPYPTICEAAGNTDDGDDTEFVNHKGYNRLTVGNHNDSATGMAGDTVFRNPDSDHGDRELPEISANGTNVTTVGLTKWGTSMAAPAVAGSTACIQEVDNILKSWPEGCRAIQLAAAKLNPDGGTWRSDLISGVDGLDGTGALNTLSAVRIAEKHHRRDNSPATRGWSVGTLRSSDIGRDKNARFSYNIRVPKDTSARHYVKVALAWDSLIIFDGVTVRSKLTLDLDLRIFDSAGDIVARSCSYDNSYEIAEFEARAGENYTIQIRRFSGSSKVWYGVAWNTVSTPLINTDDLQN